MSHQLGIPKAALNSLIQMVDYDAQVKPGMEVVILAHTDGLYGSDNLVDEQAVSWMQAVVQSRGANCSILWIDEVMKAHEWRLPPVVKGAIANADLFINTSLDLAIEEVAEFRKYIEEVKTWYVRMFPVTASLLMTEWAQTPHELVIMVRHVSSDPFMTHEAKWVMTDPNGTQLEGYSASIRCSVPASPACPTTPGAGMRATTSPIPSGSTRRSTPRKSTASSTSTACSPGGRATWVSPRPGRSRSAWTSRTAAWPRSRAARKPTPSTAS